MQPSLPTRSTPTSRPISHLEERVLEKLRLSSISNFISVPLPTDDYPGAYRHFYLAINSKIEKKCGLKIVKCLDEEKKSKNSFMALVNKSDRSRDDNRLTIILYMTL